MRLFENVIHENEGVNKPKKRKRHGVQEAVKAEGDFQDDDGKFQSHGCIAGSESDKSAWSKMMEPGKLSESYLKGELSHTFNYVNNHVKKPSIRTKTFIELSPEAAVQLLTLVISKCLQGRKHNYNTILGLQ